MRVYPPAPSRNTHAAIFATALPTYLPLAVADSEFDADVMATDLTASRGAEGLAFAARGRTVLVSAGKGVIGGR